MSDFEIVFAPGALADLEEITDWLELKAPEVTDRWLAALGAHIRKLRRFPERHPLAPENGFWGAEELRQSLFQDFPSKYRIIFTISGSQVRILNIRHGARRYLHESDDED